MPVLAALLASQALAGVPTFAAPVDIAFPNRQFPTQPALGDFNHDGTPDLLVPGRNTDGLVFVLLGNGSGFTLGRGYAVGCQTDWATAADLDGDGHLDIALAARQTPGGVVLLRGRGDGTFDDPVRLTLERETRCVQVADMDGDGRPDLLLAHAGSAALTLLHNDGAMQFRVDASARPNRWTIGTAQPSVAFVADLDSDGAPDVIDLTGGAGRIDARLSRGTGLGAERAWSLPTEGGSVVGVSLAACADLDRDGRPELLATAINFDRSNPVYAWSWSSDGISLEPRRFAGLPLGSPFNMAAADLDGDGDPDLLQMTVSVGGCLSVLENRTPLGGALDLGAPVSLLEGSFLRHVVPVDFDRDGRVDLVVCDFLAHRLRLLRNLGVAPGAAGTTVGQPSRRGTCEDPSAEALAWLEVGPPPQPPAWRQTPPDTSGFMPSVCGPGAGDCDKVHPDPGCFTTPCCEKVCAILPPCCEVTWDSDCVTVAAGECTGMVCPSRGACQTAHGGPGCEDPECCERVRRLDPSCTYVWDALCVELVPLACGLTPPTVTPPMEAADEAEHCYQALSEGCGKRADPAHAPLVPGGRRRGTITGDGVRDVDAHLLVVSERRRLTLSLHADFPAQLVLAQGPCEGPLVTLDEALAAPGGVASIDRLLDPGEYRVTVGMAVASRTLRNGQPCLEVNPDTGPQDPPPVPGLYGGVWWLAADAGPALAFGDIDASGTVDYGDVALILLGMGSDDPVLDLDGSGTVDFGDIALVLLQFG